MSSIFTDGNFLTKISPPSIICIDLITKFTASFNSIKKRLIFLSVIGKWEEFCFFNSLKNGINEPLELTAFPYLTTENLVFELLKVLTDVNNLSDANLVAP